MTLIAERPAEGASRTFPRHWWQGKLIKGACNGSAVGSPVERTTPLDILAQLDGTDALSARQGFTRKLKHVPAPLRKTLTYDREKRWPNTSAWHKNSSSECSLPIHIPMAEWHQREHQWAAAPVSAQGYGSVRAIPNTT
ncbi:MAG: hypothetical protein WBO24_03590 [Nitrospirales bacterium]